MYACIIMYLTKRPGAYQTMNSTSSKLARKMSDYLDTKDHMEVLGRPIHSPVKMLPD